MPHPPDQFSFLTAAKQDLLDVADHDPEDAKRIRSKIAELKEQTLQWGRVPQEHLEYLTDSPTGYRFYRQKIGTRGYRVIYEISGDAMVVVAVLPRTDRTYDMDRLTRRGNDSDRKQR